MAEIQMNFSDALNALKDGEKVCRAGWNGKGMWVKVISHLNWTVSVDYVDDVAELIGLPWIGMKTADGGFVPWLASQTDLLANDWMLCRG